MNEINSIQGAGNAVVTPNLSGDRASQSASSDTQQSSNPPKPKIAKSEKPFFEKVKDFFKPIITALGIIFGISAVNNKPYMDLYTDLQNQQADIQTRAQKLFNESQKVIHFANANIAANKKPWEGLPDASIGVAMSAELQTLAGDSDIQRYQHNCAVNFWAGVQLGKFSPDGNPGKAISIDDHDNTWVNKNWDPSDTGLVESLEQLYWGRKVFEMGRDSLNVEEWINTARAPFPTIIQIVPEGLEKHLTHGLLHGPLQERFGLSLKDQLEALDHCTLIALNSSIIQKPNKLLEISAKLIRQAELFKFFSGPHGPRINGKTFFESIKSLVNENGAAVFEPKSIPRYVLEANNALGETHLRVYEKITALKEKNVDHRGNKSEKEAWIDFGREVRDDAKEGDSHWKRVDRIKEQYKKGSTAEQIIAGSDVKELFGENLTAESLTDLTNDLRAKIKKNNLDDSKVMLKARQKAYQYIRLVDESRIEEETRYDFIAQTKLLDENSQYFNPQAFFQKSVEGVPVAFVVHTYDCHGTPVENAMHGIVDILKEFANNPRTRRQVAKLNSKVANGEELHSDIQRFFEKGASKFIDDGVREYLEWRILKYLECHYTKKELEAIEIFECTNGDLKFSSRFKEQCRNDNNQSFVRKLQAELAETLVQSGGLLEIISTFLPEGELSRQNSNNDIKPQDPSSVLKIVDENLNIAENLRCDLLRSSKDDAKQLLRKQHSCFFPNEIFLINSSLQYKDRYLFNSISNLVQKMTTIDPLGQYYWEIQPNREKYQGVPDFNEAIEKNLQIHVAGDSNSDIGMMVRALERKGSAGVVFNLIQDKDIFDEAIKQRKSYVNRFKNDNAFYETCKERFGICALEEVELEDPSDKNKKILMYRKVTKFENGSAVYESDKVISRDEIVNEIREKYQGRIIRNVSPEAYVRRRAEIFGLLTGTDIELNKEELTKDWAITTKKKGHLIPTEATRLDIYHEWHGSDKNGNYIVYRSKKAGNQLVIDKLNGSSPELFKSTEDDLALLEKRDIWLNNIGRFVYINHEGAIVGELPKEKVERLNDYVLENRLLQSPSGIKSHFLSKSFISNLPQLFHGLLKYSGAIMGVGGIVRLLSGLTGNLKDITYQAGYWLSNGMRAISALGGALRGELNVHKFHNIAFGEAINVISSFLPNGVKHLGLGFGNFILFLGRGQQRAQLQQRTNNHTREELARSKKLEKSIELKNYFDPRTYVRKVTEIATGLILKVKDEVSKQGIRSFIGELAGSLVSAIVTPIQMIKDLFISEGQLIFRSEYRQSEKSGTEYKGVASAGHLLTLVGALSGVGALVAGTLGRITKIGEVAEGGFNLIGRFFISFANAIPALGIIANAREVMANTGGLPKLFRDLNGKDDTYDPQKAGLRQYLAGIGFGIVPWFNLENKYIASLFDMVNGLYFLGAAEEEKPNTNMLGRSILRKRQEFYDNKQEENIVNFSNAA